MQEPTRSAARVLAEDAAYAGDRQFATTLARGLHLLTCFSPARPVLANKDFCRMLDLPKGTVSRLTYTLCQLGYLRQGSPSGGFELGSATVALGYPLLANMGLRQEARPAMNALADHARASVSMGIRDRLNIVFVETSRSRRARSSRTADIGLSYPIAATAIGWAWLAACDAREREATLNEIRVKQAENWERHGRNILRSLEQFPGRGFCASFGDLRPEIVAVAAPYPARIDGRIVVFNCAMHASRCSPEQAVTDIGPRLLEMLRGLAA
ncbi:MAG: iclR [Paucimonas sp.]|jgi:DNA-binding IclR family transcriptional regulator|nr:iclR [Paucimonas sp.]